MKAFASSSTGKEIPIVYEDYETVYLPEFTMLI